MKNCSALETRTARRMLPNACAIALAVTFTVSLAQPGLAHENEITPPLVPAGLEAPPGHEVFLVGHAVGTQNYICLPSASPPGFAFALFTPQATLYNDHSRQVTTHFFSPNPFENGTVRATWEHSRDTSTVWGQVINQSFDPNFVAPGAVPWLLVQKAGVQDGPTGGDMLSDTKYIQRVNTHGGSAPSTGCAALPDVGTKKFVPYTADYFFYMKRTDHKDR